MRSDARVRIIRGPIRSGTSSLCCQEIWRRAQQQRPAADGVRRTRWAVVRNTYPDLLNSTVKTWLNWFPEKEFGRFVNSKPMVHRMVYSLSDGNSIDCEVIFMALDKSEDVNKLRSTEWTGIWFNELEYIDRSIFDEAESRVGYYPAIKDGGATWAGVFGDMNAPTEDNWVMMLAGEVPMPDDMSEDERQAYKWPDEWGYFVQPPGLVEIFGADGKTVVSYKINPDAENLHWLPRSTNNEPLYLTTIKGKSKRWIDSRIMNRITAPIEGQPVWPMFVLETHVAKQPLRYNSNYPVYIGLDFGRQPAAVFGQLINDRWAIIGELTGDDEGASVFAPRVKKWLIQNCSGVLQGDRLFDCEDAVKAGRIRLFGDPKGNDKVQSDERTAYDVYTSFGLNVTPAPVPGNNIKTRLDAVEYVLTTMRDGMTRFLLSQNCVKLKMAMAGGYCFKKNDTQKEEPVKNKYSHIADALQYLLLGAGEGSVMTGRARPGTGAAKKPRSVYVRKSLRRCV